MKTYNDVGVRHGLRVFRVLEVRDLVPPLLDCRWSVRCVGFENGTLGSLPSNLSHESSTKFKDFAAGVGPIRMSENSDERDNELG